MKKSVSLAIIIACVIFSFPASAARYGLGFIPPAPSYVPGYGRLVHDDSFVTVYDNTGQYSPYTSKYRSRKRIQPAPSWEDYRGKRHCNFRPDAHIPKCYVYDDCSYEELYGDGYWHQCDFKERIDVRRNRRLQDRRVPLETGARNRYRNYPYGTRNSYQYQNSYNHYDSYWQDDVYGGDYNTYEWYDY